MKRVGEKGKLRLGEGRKEVRRVEMGGVGTMCICLNSLDEFLNEVIEPLF